VRLETASGLYPFFHKTVGRHCVGYVCFHVNKTNARLKNMLVVILADYEEIEVVTDVMNTSFSIG